MIHYAWFKSGYTDIDPGPFQTVIKICFKFKQDTVAYRPADDLHSFDVVIVTKYYAYMISSLIIILRVSDFYRHTLHFYDSPLIFFVLFSNNHANI